MANHINIEIADVVIAIENKAGLDQWDIFPANRLFIRNQKADIRLRLLRGYPVISAAKQIFDSSPIWTLHRQGDTTAIKIFDHYDGQKRILLLGPDICTADLYFPELIVIEVDSSLSENL
jgi:hypothetical protein